MDPALVEMSKNRVCVTGDAWRRVRYVQADTRMTKSRRRSSTKRVECIADYCMR